MTASTDTKDNGRVKKFVWTAILLWFLLALGLGGNGSFVRDPGALPLPILVGVLTPIALFLAAFRYIGPFNDFVMSLDLQLAAGMQAWRFGGFVFIALYVYGVLPGLFAWPAGLGDMAIGFTAVWVLLALRDRQDFAPSRVFWVWNLLGILDLVVAVSLGAFSSVFGIGISGEVTTFPMAQMPLVLIPVFLVPLFVMLHLASLFQLRHLAESGEAYERACPNIRRGPAKGTA